MSSELGLTSLIGPHYTAKKRCAGSKLLPFLTPAPSVSRCGVTSPVLQLQERGWGMKQDVSCNQSSRSVAITAGGRQGSGAMSEEQELWFFLSGLRAEATSF